MDIKRKEKAGHFVLKKNEVKKTRNYFKVLFFQKKPKKKCLTILFVVVNLSNQLTAEFNVLYFSEQFIGGCP